MKNKKGFTLIELVVVMAVIAVLALVLIGAIIAARNTASNTANRANANTIRIGLEAHFARHNAYCGSAPMMPCLELGVGRTFTQVAAALNANLGTGSVTLGSSTANTANAGGGRVTTASTGPSVTITAVDWNNANMQVITLP